MTIKVIQHKNAGKIDQVGRPMTYLREGEEVYYKFVDFKNRVEFLERYNKTIEGRGSVSIAGIPDEYWGKKEIEAGMFLCIYYGKRSETPNCLIEQNATIFIMQGGQTIDKIHC